MEPESLITLVTQLREENARLRAYAESAQGLLNEMKAIRAKRKNSTARYTLTPKGKAEVARIRGEGNHPNSFPNER